jgi:hypothetical protein
MEGTGTGEAGRVPES